VSDLRTTQRHDASPSAWRRRILYGIALTLGLAVAAMGYATSFSHLSTYGAAHAFPLGGAALPIGLDLGIPALLLLDWLSRSLFLRGAAWFLAAWTVFANGAVTGGGATDRLLHAMMPAVAIVVVEAARHLRDDPGRMDRIRMSRWLLSPVRTSRLQRRMVLWEITSYSEALARESAILYARTVLMVAHGQRSWARTRKLVPQTLVHQLATGQVPSSVLYGADLQTAVRDWIRAALDDLALNPTIASAQPARSEASAGEDPRRPEVSRWDLIWDLQDSLCPAGVAPGTFAQAIGLARRHYEQVGGHMTFADLQEQLKIAKPRANAIGQALRTAFETGVDPAVRSQVPAATPSGGSPMAAGSSPDLVDRHGLNMGLAAAAGGGS
jgi:hypothetical protein